MNLDPTTNITEGEIYGAPVPGGWPDRGPFHILGNALGRVFSRRKSGDSAEALRRPAGETLLPTSENAAEDDPQK